jgi:tetratricopeptide (TPR) repeat protein/serine phosphatase RsbU (regulator of sigma subunit)
LAEQELKLANSMPDEKGKKWMAKAFNTIGFSYTNKNNYPKALAFDLKSLRIYEELKSSSDGNTARSGKQGLGVCYCNIGIVYYYQSDYQKALEYFLKSLKIREETGNKLGVGNTYIWIGNVYNALSDYSKALEYYLKGLKIFEEVNDKNGMEVCYVNIGIIYSYQSDYSKALNYYFKSLKISKEVEDKKGVGTGYNNIGELYTLLKDYKSALKYSDSALQIGKEIGDINIERNAYANIAKAYSKTDNYKEAYLNHVKFKTLTDSIFNADNSKQLGDLKTNFELEKKEAELKAKADAEEVINKEETKRQQFIIYGGAGVLLIVIAFSAFLYRRVKITQKQKRIIEEQKFVVEQQKLEVEKQKSLVEEHQKEIIDSITYAKRLQQAILPANEEIQKYLPDSFVYYQPKDIVAGDFYWMHVTKEAVYIAAADCTGHGVPGAMVSVVCSNALNRAVNEFNLTDTGLILDKTRASVIETFEKSDSAVKDGMDISLLKINLPIGGITTKIQWSGANNSLWYILNNELIEVKADKQPIGKYGAPIPFTTNTFNFNFPVSFYLFSDGYADQFNANDKKLMKKKFRDIVLSVQGLSMDKQGEYLEKAHMDWKGLMEQTDDVLVIGIQVKGF